MSDYITRKKKRNKILSYAVVVILAAIVIYFCVAGISIKRFFLVLLVWGCFWVLWRSYIFRFYNWPAPRHSLMSWRDHALMMSTMLLSLVIAVLLFGLLVDGDEMYPNAAYIFITTFVIIFMNLMPWYLKRKKLPRKELIVALLIYFSGGLLGNAILFIVNQGASISSHLLTYLYVTGILTIIYFIKYKKIKIIMKQQIVAGNWKMNTTPAQGVELAAAVAEGKKGVNDDVKLIVCPPFTHLSEVVKTTRGTGIAVGAQNCAAEAKGAYTGEVSAEMLSSLGVEYVILGHSERREYYGETSATLNKKMEQAYANNLIPIYCVGEKLEEREAGKQNDVVKAQIEEVVYNLTPEQFGKLVIAYEPVWAIGTGKTATSDQAEEIHAYIRKVLAAKFGAAAGETPILYGGSCNPGNAKEIFSKENVDGGLIGGAALKADDFIAIGKSF